MTLENIQYKLQGLVNQISSQNENHYDLNESILGSIPVPDDKISEGASPPEGLLSEIYKLIWRLEKEVDFQSHNVGRTKELVHQKEMLPESSPSIKVY